MNFSKLPANLQRHPAVKWLEPLLLRCRGSLEGCKFKPWLGFLATGNLCEPSSKMHTCFKSGTAKTNERGMKSSFHMLCPRYSGPLPPLPQRSQGCGKSFPLPLFTWSTVIIDTLSGSQQYVPFHICLPVYYSSVFNL